MYILYLVYDCKVNDEYWDTILLNKMYVFTTKNKELKVEFAKYIFSNFIH